MVDLSINRPIYLARRDRCYIEAANLLYDDVRSFDIIERCDKLKSIVELFSQTRENALFAMRGYEANQEEINFDKCLELVIDSLEAALIMSQHEELLSHDKSFLIQFLGKNLKTLDLDLEAAHEAANNIIDRTRVLVHNLTEQFELLRKESFDDLSEDHKERYSSMFNYE